MKAWFIALSLGTTLLFPAESRAAQLIGPTTYAAGSTPFISFARLRVSDVANLRYAQFQIAPKSGSATRPINVRYSRQYLQERGYFNSGTGKLTVPVFGLYAGRSNSVIITVGFKDGTSQRTHPAIQTAAYDGGTYSNPNVAQAR